MIFYQIDPNNFDEFLQRKYFLVPGFPMNSKHELLLNCLGTSFTVVQLSASTGSSELGGRFYGVKETLRKNLMKQITSSSNRSGTVSSQSVCAPFVGRDRFLLLQILSCLCGSTDPEDLRF